MPSMPFEDAAALGDLPRIPPLLIYPARELMRALGVDPGAVRDDGSLDVPQVVAAFVHEVELDTAYFPPIKADLRRMAQADRAGPPRQSSAAVRLLRALRPHLIIRTVGGQIETAPFGKPRPGEGAATWQRIKLVGAVVGAAAVGGIVYAAVKSYQRPARPFGELPDGA